MKASRFFQCKLSAFVPYHSFRSFEYDFFLVYKTQPLFRLFADELVRFHIVTHFEDRIGSCPFLFDLDTVAFFPVIRGRHSFDAIAKIRDTTQLFLDVYPQAPDGKELFVRPVKVWNRYSQTMFNPHKYNIKTGAFSPISESVEISRFYQRMNQAGADTADQNMDSWERFFRQTKLKYKSGEDVSEECSRICDIMLTRDKRMRELIKDNFTARDYFEIHSRMVGTGMIGGKACGMLLARKIVENTSPDIFGRVEPHDSFYIGSDVFYSFIVDNGFWDLKIRQKTEEEYFSLSEEFSERIMNGRFSPGMEAEFRRFMNAEEENENL